MIKNYGCIDSDKNLKINKFKVISSFKIPDEYSCENLLPDVDDQRKTKMCVPCALSAYFNWFVNVNNGYSKENNIDIKQIYNSRKYPGNKGMKFVSAFEFLKNVGVFTDFGTLKINDYLSINDILALKQAILLNGPCMASIKLNTNENTNEFWKGNSNLGNHAIAIVGYNQNGFLIRNSWGKSYGNNGYYILPYDEFHNIVECWTIIMY